MKPCSKCGRRYDDETLNYCLDDGELLQQDAALTAGVLETGTVFEFGSFRLDTNEKVLLRDGETLTITPKVFDTLQILLQKAGHLLQKDEIIKRVWPQQFVEEGNLAYTIGLLRKALGDDAAAPTFIETIPKRGYRFIADVHRRGPIHQNQKSIGVRVPPDNLLTDSRQGVYGPLIGRVKETAEITGLLARHHVRLVTLTGIGGTGKTRLAQEIARHIKDQFADGVWWVDLSTVVDESRVAPAIVHALGVPESGSSLKVALTDHFRDRSMLLILDNFEQVVTAAPQLTEYLRVSPGLKILVTSREPLKLRVEEEYQVPSLAVPTEEGSRNLTDLQSFEAIQLFVERAKRARPGFEITEQNGDVVSAICRKLDGLPLALELAAARARMLSVSEILNKLKDSLTLLTGGARDLPDRQKTMRATIEWTYELLNGLEKRVFAVLPIFEGGFTLEAAEIVLIGASPDTDLLSETQVFDAITSLTEKGLLIVQRYSAQTRFRMLAVVRDFGLELLFKSADPEKLFRAHAEYFLKFTETASPFLFSPASPEWLDRLERERDNIVAALSWSLKNHPQTSARILASIRHLAGLRWHTGEMRYWLEEALEKGDDLPLILRCEMLTGLGIMCQYQLDLTTSRATHMQCLEISRQVNDKALTARALRGIGAIDYMELNLPQSRKRVNEALAISRSINDEFGEAAAISKLADIALAENDAANGRRLLLSALSLFTKLGYKQGISAKLINLAMAEFAAGDHDASRNWLGAALTASVELMDQIDLRVNFEVAAALAVEAGEHHMAARLSGMAAARCEHISYFYEPVEQRFREAYIAKLQNSMSKDKFDTAFAEGRRMSVAEALDLAHNAAEAGREEPQTAFS